MTAKHKTQKSTATRKLTIGINAIVFAVLVVVGLVLVNVVSARVYSRGDLTEDNLYTLSSSSKKLVKSLPRPLHVKIFVSEKLLPGYRETAQYIEDLLDEYKNASNGNFKWEVIHPELKDEYKKEAERYGIKAFVARAKAAHALEARTITFGIVLSYTAPGKAEQVEVLPQIFPGIERNIEYLLSERIKRLTVRRKKVLVLTGHGEFPIRQQDKVKQFIQSLFNQYEVQMYPITGKTSLPDNADILLVVTPSRPYTKKEDKLINDFIMKGKSALFMIDGLTKRQRPMMMMQKSRMPPIFVGGHSGLENLLKTWGVTINQDIVMDHKLQIFPVGRRVVFHPAIPAIQVRGIRGTVTPFLASTLSVKQAYLGKNKKEPYHILPLMVTSSKAWIQKPPFIFSIQSKPRPSAGTKLKAYLLGVAVEGSLPSFAASTETKDATDTKDAAKPAPKHSTGTARIVVIGDADMLWLTRQMMPNRVFIQNVMDWLAQDEMLVKLRNKMAQDRSLTLPESRAKILLIKLANMVGLPFLVILAGLILLATRKMRRKNAEL